MKWKCVAIGSISDSASQNRSLKRHIISQEQKLQQRIDDNNFRKLRLTAGLVDLCSNDYLGLARTSGTTAAGLPVGSGGSRLLAGNYAAIEDLERKIADFHEAESGLIYNSGYDANLGLLSCIGLRGDTIVYDQLSHASIRDGIRLSYAQSLPFAHNDVQSLEERLRKSVGTVYVITESLFSMDGDLAPLAAITSLCERYQAKLIVDEAHATGVIGPRGEGLVQALGLTSSCFARIHTFGKAVGAHGAIVLGSQFLRSYLVNFSRAFIYTTALPPSVIAHISNAYERFPTMQEERAHLSLLITQFKSLTGSLPALASDSPIQALLVPGNEAVIALAEKLEGAGFDIRPIRYPTVPLGSERLRIVLHSFNTSDQLVKLFDVLHQEAAAKH